MNIRAFSALFLFVVTTTFSVAPKTDVVIETGEGILLHAEYISETAGNAMLDVRAALMPANLCEEKDFPKYIPKGKLKNPVKMTSGHCLYAGKPYAMRSLGLPQADIKKRYDTALITLSNNSEKKQVPFYGVHNNSAWGFNLTPEPIAGGGTPPAVGLQAFPMDKTMDTIQTVDVDGARKTLHPPTGFFQKYRMMDPRIGVTWNPLMPTGAISALKFSVVGVNVYTSVALPDIKALKKNNLRLRGGLLAGFHSLSGDQTQNGEAVADAKITLIPVFGQLALYWDLKPRGTKFTISPSFKFATGVIFSSVSTQLKSQYLSQLASASAETSRSGSYVGYALQPALGVEIKHGSMPNLAYFLDAGYLYHFEQTSGSFFSFHLGAAYHYGIPAAEPKMLPITYVGAKSVVVNLKGLVRQPDGTAIVGASIIVRAKGSTSIVKQAAAGDKGQYNVEIEPGLDYEIEAAKDGYVKSVFELPLMSNDKKTLDHEFILAPMTYSLEGVNFKPDSDELIKGKGPEKALMELVKFLQANPNLKIEIGGHTAASGADDENSRKLSKKRAESVRKFIIGKGIEEGRLTSEGYGGSAPIADGKTAAGAAKNRRVEVKILTE